MSNNKTSALGYFKYFKSFIGNRIYVYILLNFLIGLFDGLGLAMFIPLISIATGNIDDNNASLGKLKFVVDTIKSVGLELNLITALSIMILMFIIKGMFYYIKLNYLNKTQLIALTQIRFSLVNHLRNLSYEGFTKMDAGKVQNNMVGETGKLMSAMGSYFTTLHNIVLLFTYVLMAFASNWKFAIIVGIGVLFTNLFYSFINKKIKEYSTFMVGIAHVFNGTLIQTIQNFKYLRATNNFKVFEKRLKDNINESEKLSYKAGKISYIGESLREPMIIIVIGFVIYIQVALLNNNFNSILVSLLLFYKSLGFVVSMQSTWSSFIRTSVGIESVENLIHDLKKEGEQNNEYIIDNIQDLRLENITLTYGNKNILDNVSLDIPVKNTVAFVGESGAGKTTLANVACGLIFPHSGVVLSGNQSIYDSNINSFRERVGDITQETVIFDDTLYNNITFWAPKTKENIDKFNRVISMVSLEKFINNLELKEDSPLGNNGVLISGGQKQRISIARELYKDTELLILDEATSALDSETEKHIKENIDILHGKFTMVIIAHRLSTIKNVDKIFLMEDGQIVDSGSFQDLILSSQKFKKMVDLQKVS